MGKYNFKDVYYNSLGQKVESLLGHKKYVSTIAPKYSEDVDGSRSKPHSLNNSYMVGGGQRMHYMMGAGIYSGRQMFNGQDIYLHYYGAGIGKTIIDDLTVTANYDIVSVNDLKDLTFSNIFTNVRNCRIYNCEVKNVTNKFDFNSINCSFSKIRVNSFSGTNLSYVGVKPISLRTAQLNLFDDCDVSLTSAQIRTYENYWNAFNNCRFRIGAEEDFLPLIGKTEEELRDDFVRRCHAQGITISNISDMSETLKQGRWIFSNDSCVDGLVIQNSVIHNFEKRRLISFGYSQHRGDIVAISGDKNKPSSFSPSFPNTSVVVADNSISFPSNLDISKFKTAYCDSNIIWLGGKYQVNMIDILHNFPRKYGIDIDSTPTLSGSKVSVIEKDKNYYVRSLDNNEAIITYDGVKYSSALLARNNVLRGVAGKTSFASDTANAAVYEILDEVQHQTIQMRIVNKIPSALVASGALQAGYWYLVEPESSDDISGSVIYDGVSYPAYASFIAVDGKLTFTTTGNVRLRRCWKDLYNENDSDTTDKAFWQNEQKPIWFDVLSDDLRCLMAYNNGQQAEMQRDSKGDYIGSGHPDFYNSLLGVSGNPGLMQAFPIKGTYMQLRLVITTQNPM